MADIEKSGVPTIAIGSRTFETDFKTSGRMFGIPELPHLCVADQALTTLEADEIYRRVEDIVDRLAEDFTSAARLVEERVTDGEITSLATALFGQEVPEIETFEGEDRLEAWEKMNASFLDRQWGDGFPLVAPTPRAVEQMLAGTRRAPDDVVTVLEPCFGIATVEKIAINAVMAGCKPEHLPILIAAVECIVDPGYELRHMAMSTAPHTPMLVVNGPIAKRIGLNSGMCCLGPGAPSAVNTCIGRAMRLILMNVGGNYSGVTDMDTIGEPNKYSMCLAEREEANPWEPLHVERGFAKEDSTVTVFVAYTTITHTDHTSTQPLPFIKSLADSVCAPGCGTSAKWLWMPKKGISSMALKPDDYHEDCVIILCPNDAKMLGRAGWGKVGVKEVLHSFAKMKMRDRPGTSGQYISKYGVGENNKGRPEWSWLHDYPDFEVPMYRTPDCYQIIVAGADSQKNMVVLGGKKASTRRIED